MAFDVTNQICRTCQHVQPTSLNLQLMPRTLLDSKPTHEKRSAEDQSHVLSLGTTPLCLAAKAFYVVQLRAKSYEVASMPVQPMMHIPPSINQPVV